VRILGTIAASVAVLVAALAAGCGSDSILPIRLSPTPPPAVRPALGPAMFMVRVVRLQHRQRADASVEDVWRLLGATTAPYEKRALWEANDLRMGDGAQLAADRMNELATDTADRTTQTTLRQVRENLEFTIPIGAERDAINILWSDASGRLQGRWFEKCQAQFRMVCRSDPTDPEAVRIALVPEILWGPDELHWVVNEVGNVVQKMGPSSFLLSDFAAEVRLPAKRLLVLGAKPSPGLSVGPALFCEQRGPDVWDQAFIVTVERLKPGEIPEGSSVPLSPPATAPGKTSTAAPKVTTRGPGSPATGSPIVAPKASPTAPAATATK
jgi:hypothetical protein